MISNHHKIELKSNQVSFTFLKTGDLYKIMGNSILINQLLTNDFDGSLNNLYLRIHTNTGIKFFPLLGINSGSRVYFSEKQVVWKGIIENISYKVFFHLTEHDIWFWDILLEGNGEIVDVIYGQDIGLADKDTVQSNEAYTCQYIDHKVFHDEEKGYIVCSRQNMSQTNGQPYIQQGSFTKSVGYSTDGFQFFGLTYKETNQPEILSKLHLANEIYQYEFAYTALQSEKVKLQGKKVFSFYGIFKMNHPETIKKVEYLDEIIKARKEITHKENEKYISIDKIKRKVNLGVPLRTISMTLEEINSYFPNRHEEEYHNGRLLSFFTETHEHVVLKEKELLVERPHGHILMSGNNHYRTDNVLTTTCYMYGVMNSQLLVGNTTYNKLLSNTRNALNITKTSGQRLYIEIDGIFHLLAMPSMFEMGFNYSRWYYKTNQDLIIITNYTSVSSTQLTLHIKSAQKKSYRYVITNQIVMNDIEYELPYIMEIDQDVITFYSNPKSLNKTKYPDLCYKMYFKGADFKVRNGSFLFEGNHKVDFPLNVIEVGQSSEWILTIQGLLDGGEIEVNKTDQKKEIEKYRAYFNKLMNNFKLSYKAAQEQIEKVNDLVWWYTHNMLVHYSVPHGLEQFGGAAWGTRDVCQGPVEYFLATENYNSVREILKIVYSHQYENDGNWPQWFMFDRYYQIQQEESHGDIAVWPLKVMSEYLLVTGDYSILDEKIPYTTKEEFQFTTKSYPLKEHIEKEIEYIKNHFLYDTHLSSYGNGDWDDTLQPASRQMKQYMISSWTVALTYQTIRQMSQVLMDVDVVMAEQLEKLAEDIKRDFNKYILQSDVLPGFLYMEEPNKPEYMLHPEDTKTGIHYRLIPMTRSIISELFEPEQAKQHFQFIKEHLYFPDGVRLMNKPANYTGGNSVRFLRAEQAANFGREIGLQYVHAHIRFVEAMAKLGEADEAWTGLEIINPIGIQKVVQNAELRQSNVYFSSSDGKFNTRYEAQERFNELKIGKVKVKAGWRIYSSGPGIYVNQLITNVLGIRVKGKNLIIDPVLPARLNGLEFGFAINNIPVTFVYHIGGNEVKNVVINGKSMELFPVNNPYRNTGAAITLEDLKNNLFSKNKENRIDIFIK
ncbi:cellobiose phosphorylase [Caldifermentibacillus hisashii]|uniref:GH36-type glycosyl hydrolase domain-containing protein n=1 Tax=Caldifermentibacillus hisashii TaxID=996558 RepID=UPI0031B72908